MQETEKNIEKIMKAVEQILAGRKVTGNLDPAMITAIKQLLKTSDVAVDSKFKKSLDRVIRDTLSQIAKQRSKKPYSLKESLMKYFLTFLSGAFATTIIALIVLNQLDVITFPFQSVEDGTVITQTDDRATGEMVSGEANVATEVSHEDFGDLPALAEGGAVADGKGGGGSAMGMGGGGGYMPPYYGGELYPPKVTYTYSSEEKIEVPQSMTIYKTEKTEISAKKLDGMMKDFGVVLSKLVKEGVFAMTYMNFYNSETKRSYNIDFSSGVLSFYTNIEYDPNRKQPAEEDIPQDRVLLRIANSFLQEHGIDPSTLNPPEVDKRWKIYYDQEKRAMQENGGTYQLYIPTTMSVVYPKMLDGIAIVDFSGGKIGDVRVDIDIIDNIVTGGSINLSLSLEKTQYPTQAFDQITKILKETGGTNGFNYGPMPLQIGTPEDNLKPPTIDADYTKAELVYIEKYQWTNNETKIYYVPVVMFTGKVKHSDQKEPYDQVTFVPIISADSF